MSKIELIWDSVTLKRNPEKNGDVQYHYIFIFFVLFSGVFGVYDKIHDDNKDIRI
jgi:hypothetical protein